MRNFQGCFGAWRLARPAKISRAITRIRSRQDFHSDNVNAFATYRNNEGRNNSEAARKRTAEQVNARHAALIPSVTFSSLVIVRGKKKAGFAVISR
jgi:hypothetical protein